MAGIGDTGLTQPSWLPDALQYADFHGDWGEFLATVYQIFERDFKQSRPSYEGKTVVHDTRIEDGKEVGFWHITCRYEARTHARETDLRRCERIPWPRPMIEHSTDRSLSVRKNKRKKPGSPRQTRVLIWLENLDYLVVLAERPKAMILVTAYCTDIESHKEKLRKERGGYGERQKPPGKAT
jgi:hypothetical protein